MTNCFRRWPEPAVAAARRLAAQANAARGRELLWIIGADASGRVPGAGIDRFEGWLSALRPWFDGLAPRVEACVVPVDASTVSGKRRAEGKPRAVVALRIDTGRAPFVVRRAGGGGGLEVPWESPGEDAAPRAATRMELVKLLSPLAELPRFEVLEAELNFYKNLHAMPGSRTPPAGVAPTHFRWSLDACIYVLPSGGNGHGGSVVLPKHRCRGAVELASLLAEGSNGEVDAPASPGPLHAGAAEFSVTADSGSPAVRVTDSAVLVEGLGRFFVYLCGTAKHPRPAWQEPATVRLDFGPAGAERVAVAEARLGAELVTEPNQLGRWKL